MNEQKPSEIENDNDLTDESEELYRRDHEDFSLDIDAALAAVTSLSDLVAEREAEESEARHEIELAEQKAEERARWVDSYVFPQPTLTRMQRGQLSSVIPAILLIVSGAYLTFALTLSDTPPSPGIVALIVCGVIGMTLLSHWLTSGRWARGALFLGLVLIFTGGVLFYTTLPDMLLPGWTLMVAAFGLAAALSGVLARPASGRITALGLGIIASAGFIFAASLGLIPVIVLDSIRVGWIAIVPVLAVLLLLALIFRRRTT